MKILAIALLALVVAGCQGVVMQFVTDDMINAKMWRNQHQERINRMVDLCESTGFDAKDWRVLKECVEADEEYQPKILVERTANRISEWRDRIALRAQARENQARDGRMISPGIMDDIER